MSDERSLARARAEELLGLLKRGAEFTKELLQENEKLRSQIVSADAETRAAAPKDFDKIRAELLQRIQGLEQEQKSTLERLSELEDENQEFARRFVEVEQENNNLANLYVASFQLHSTLSVNEVLRNIVEIVINLIGAEKFAIYVLDDNTDRLEAVAAEGEDVSAFPKLTLGSGVIGSAVKEGKTVCQETAQGDDLGSPLVCIPLRIDERPIGGIAIYQLLQQKDRFTPLDHELFNLLGGHAATALFSSKLYSQSERKRHTMQGLLELLTR